MEKLEALEKLPEGQGISCSVKPEGENMRVQLSCQFFVKQDKYEAIKSQIMFKILEIKKIIEEAEKQGWLKTADISLST